MYCPGTGQHQINLVLTTKIIIIIILKKKSGKDMTDAKQNICLAEETAPMTEYTASSPQQFYVLGTHHNI